MRLEDGMGRVLKMWHTWQMGPLWQTGSLGRM
jgi:hypothetical protein